MQPTCSKLATDSWSQRERQILMLLALIGAALLLFQLWAYIGWLLDDIPLARTQIPVPDHIIEAVRRAETLIGCGAVLWLVGLIYQTFKHRRLTWQVMLTIAWVLVYWQESLVNAQVHAFSYNAYFLNRGDWISHLPLFASKQPLLDQPLLMEPLVFFWLLPLAGICVSGFLKLVSRWIHSPLLLVLAGAVLGTAMETSFEFSAISQQLLAWNYVSHDLSLRTATPLQWPLGELPLGVVWGLPGIAWFFRNKTWLRWIDPSNGPSGAGFAAVRILALAAAINLVFLAYNTVLIVIPAKATADFPVWLSEQKRRD